MTLPGLFQAFNTIHWEESVSRGSVRSNGKGVSSLQMAWWCRPSVPGGLVMGPNASKPACQGSTGYSEEERRKIGQLKLTRLGGVEM